MNDRMKDCMNECMTVVCMFYYLNGNKHIKEKKKYIFCTRVLSRNYSSVLTD